MIGNDEQTMMPTENKGHMSMLIYKNKAVYELSCHNAVLYLPATWIFLAADVAKILYHNHHIEQGVC